MGRRKLRHDLYISQNIKMINQPINGTAMSKEWQKGDYPK